MTRRPPRSTLFPYTPLSRSRVAEGDAEVWGRLLKHRPARGLDPRVAVERAPAGPAHAEEHARLDAFEREEAVEHGRALPAGRRDRKSTRLNSSHANISYAVF